jgi:hypothetical protein
MACQPNQLGSIVSTSRETQSEGKVYFDLGPKTLLRLGKSRNRNGLTCRFALDAGNDVQDAHGFGTETLLTRTLGGRPFGAGAPPIKGGHH